MYLTFYGLKKQPFHVTPDPEFLYLSHSHKEALAAIIYGIAEKKGFVAITGPVGVGKTTILRSYLESAERDRLKIAYVFNAKQTFEGLLKTIYRELGVQIESKDTVEMVNRLYEVLIEEYRQGNTVVLVLDEAQNMPVDTLESLRMISNIETSRDKLIQIVLVGQPEFEEKLNLHRLRQLKQRLAVRSTILPFTKDESLGYIKFRFRKAGGDVASAFTAGALKKIVKRANGIPRIINILSDNALITGFGYQRKPVTKQIVREIIRDFDGSKRSTLRRRWLPVTSAGAAFLLLAVAFWWYLPQHRDALLASVRVPKLFHEPKRSNEAVREARSAKTEAAKESPSLAKYEPGQPPEGIHSIGGMVTKTVAAGDTLLGLIREVYGLEERDPGIRALFDLVRQRNPQIRNTNVILVGQQITFPESPKSIGKAPAKRDAPVKASEQ